jgi:hypothetical protein
MNTNERVAFLSRPKNSIWLALDGDVAVGFMRYEGYDFNGVAIVESDAAVSITGAYIRPATGATGGSGPARCRPARLSSTWLDVLCCELRILQPRSRCVLDEVL